MKRFFSAESSGVGFLASVNLAVAAAVKVMDMRAIVDTYDQVMHFLIPLGQFGVAAVTIYYILRKARAVPEKFEKKPVNRNRKRK